MTHNGGSWMTKARMPLRRLDTNTVEDLGSSRCIKWIETMFIMTTKKNIPRCAVVRAALAEALVHYYPLAGHLREAPGGRLVVECIGDGMVFVEAEADVSLDELGEPPLAACPFVEELLCDVGDLRVVLGVPLFFMQVTQLRCGGFVIGLHICQNIADGYSSTQFLKCIVDLACTRGDASQIVSPVWNRDLLTTHIPSHINPAYEEFLQRLGTTADDIMLSTPLEEMVGRFFLFGPGDMASLRRHAPAHLTPPVTSFELLTTVMWRCRTVALGYKLHQRVRLMFSLNASGRWKRHALVPRGFYGNALFYPAVHTTAEELCFNPLGYALGLIREAKCDMTDDNMESMVDFTASMRGQPPLTMDRMYEASDIKWVGQDALDFGWAKRVDGGVPMVGDIPSKSMSYHMRYRNGSPFSSKKKHAMDKFEKEIAVWVNNEN
ncbi:hypothetical protein VPH35_057393 [Triticum aestivum]